MHGEGLPVVTMQITLLTREVEMEALYQSFMAIPLKSVGLLGLVQIIFIAGAVIFKLVITVPKKEKMTCGR